jgi:hypothetical protein
METHVPPPLQIPQTLMLQLKNLGPLLDAAVHAHDLGAEIFTSHIFGNTLDTDFKVVVYIMFAKGFKTFQSAMNLCRCGCGSDALSLCAALYENYVDLRYIALAPATRSRRFIQFEDVEKYYYLQKILSHKRLPKGRRKTFRAFQAKVTPRVTGLLKYFAGNGWGGWSQKSIRQRAKSAGAAAALEYDELYWVFCGHKHTGPATVGTLIVEGAELVFGPNIKGVYEAAWHSTFYFLKLCDVYQHSLNLGLTAQVNAALQKVSTAREAVYNDYPDLCT